MDHVKIGKPIGCSHIARLSTLSSVEMFQLSKLKSANLPEEMISSNHIKQWGLLAISKDNLFFGLVKSDTLYSLSLEKLAWLGYDYVPRYRDFFQLRGRHVGDN